MDHNVQPALQVKICIPVPTVTIVVAAAGDPYRILLGKSAKHPYEVLPGGKIDCADVHEVSDLEGATRAACRELEEEIGVQRSTLRFLERMERTGADERHIPRKSLAGSLAAKALPAGDPEELVIGQYGIPDYIFIATVHPDEVLVGSELPVLRWASLRKPLPKLSAGHADILERYLQDVSVTKPFSGVSLPPLPPQFLD